MINLTGNAMLLFGSVYLALAYKIMMMHPFVL
jgi:hypothetical protein